MVRTEILFPSHDPNILQYLLSVPFGEEATEGCIRLVETEDGVQLQIVADAQ